MLQLGMRLFFFTISWVKCKCDNRLDGVASAKIISLPEFSYIRLVFDIPPIETSRTFLIEMRKKLRPNR
jgi:hypothetical protein